MSLTFVRREAHARAPSCPLFLKAVKGLAPQVIFCEE